MDKRRVKKNAGLKGSVLYTVTLVMMVMIILMMSAIALAGTANKRAFGEYHDDQTTYTGRSVINSVLNSFGVADDLGGNKGLGTHIATELIAKPSKSIIVNVNNQVALPDGFGTVEKLEFKYVGIDSEDGFYISGSGYKIFKVTATVKMGNETTTHSEYVCGVNANSSGGGGGAGFLASVFNLPESTGGTFHGPSYTLLLPERDASGDFIIDAEGNYDWPDPYAQAILDFRNPTHLSGGAMYASTVRFTTDNAQVSFLRNNHGSNGISASGNIAVLNPMSFLSEYKPGGSDSITNIPYIYCDGTFYTAVKPFIGTEDGGTDARSGNPINIYAGRVLFPSNPGNVYSSIYCYNTDETYNPADIKTSQLAFTVPTINEASSTVDVNNDLDGQSPVSVIAGNADGTQLLDWAAGTVGDKRLQTGSIYTMGSLKLGTAAYARVIVQGDVSVNQILDMTDCSSDSEIHGNIYVNGQLMVNDLATLNTILKNPATVTCRKITDASGNDLSGAVSGNITIKDDAFTWPIGMSKDDILGHNDDANKIVQTSTDAFKLFYDADNQKFRRSENQSMLEVSGSTEIYYYGDNEVKMRTVSDSNAVSKTKNVNITNSCTIAGSFSGCTFNITPPDKGKIWINLYDVNFSDCDFIVDDSEGREVYFYIPQGDNYSPSTSLSDEAAYFDVIEDITGVSRDVNTLTNSFYANNTHFLTLNYHETFFGNGKTLVENLDLKTYYKKEDDHSGGNTSDTNFVPDLFICAADNKRAADNQPLVSLEFTNQCVITGHITALDASFSWANTSHNFSNGGFSYTLDGATQSDTFPNSNISVIGSVFVASIKQIQNDFQCFYVDYYAKENDDIDNGDNYSWATIDGYITY